ncbi:unnamed protein product [Notodromas monacha]|uniref:MIT domain-containing protein n=1 Tax=Notodromas monacha TaxID=399045 RepID=A0A7R9BPS6_9CRUS|nr:unnamed protein product [Notodromas monacha]CAG0919441.1 unnamed protein product [Notodromas monacha]
MTVRQCWSLRRNFAILLVIWIFRYFFKFAKMLAGPSDPSVVRVQELHKKAFNSISAALDVDTTKHNFPEALRLYKIGLDDIEKCLSIDLSYGKGPGYDRARTLQDKMRKNKMDVEDRIVKLGDLISLGSRQEEQGKPRGYVQRPVQPVAPNRQGFYS